MGKALTDFGSSAMKIGKGMTKVGDSMTRNLTLPILGVGVATGKLAFDFDTTMNRIVGLAKVPRDQIQGVRDDILKMAGDVGRSPQELAQAFYFVASAGFKADEAMQVLKISAKAAAAGMGETQDVAKVLGGVINAYGHENITAAKAGDVLTAAVQDGAGEAVDFAGAIGQVVPTAAAMGVSFDQVTAAMSAMTNVSIDAETAATNLNQIFSSLLKPTSEADNALKGVGLSAAGLRQEIKDKGLLDTLRTVQGAFEGNDTAIASVFGNIRALRGVNALLSLDEKQLTGIFNDTAGAVGNLGQAYDDTDGPQRQIAKSMADLQANAITIGEDVLPIVVDVLHDLAGGAKEFAKWWATLDDGTKQFIVHALAVIAVAGPLLSMIGRITTGVGGLSKGIGFLNTKLPLLTTASKAALGPLGVLLAMMAAPDDVKLLGGENSPDKVEGRVHDLVLSFSELAGLPDAIPVEELSARAKAAAAMVAAGLSGSLAGGAPDFRTAADKVTSGLTDSTQDAHDDAEAIIRMTPADLAKALLAGQTDWQQAVDDYNTTVKENLLAPAEMKAVSAQIKIANSDLAAALKSGDPEWIAAAEAKKTILEDRLFALQNDVPKIALDTGTSYADALTATAALSKAAGGHVTAALEKELEVNLKAGGLAAALSWIEGIDAAKGAAVEHARLLAAAVAKNLVGLSPPPEGPLHTIDQGGRNIISAWLAAMLGMRSAAASAGAGLAAHVAAGLSGGFPAAGLGSLSVPSAMGGMVGVSNSIRPTAAAGVVNNYNLTVAGKEPVVSTAQDIVREQNRMGRFGGTR